MTTSPVWKYVGPKTNFATFCYFSVMPSCYCLKILSICILWKSKPTITRRRRADCWVDKWEVLYMSFIIYTLCLLPWSLVIRDYTDYMGSVRLEWWNEQLQYKATGLEKEQNIGTGKYLIHFTADCGSHSIPYRECWSTWFDKGLTQQFRVYSSNHLAWSKVFSASACWRKVALLCVPNEHKKSVYYFKRYGCDLTILSPAMMCMTSTLWGVCQMKARNLYIISYSVKQCWEGDIYTVKQFFYSNAVWCNETASFMNGTL
jgi:hypothetical protein